MRLGIIVNALSVFVGGLIGSRLGKNIHGELKENLPTVFGISAMVIGISKIGGFKSLTAVILSLIMGYVIGELIDIQKYIDNLCFFLLDKLKIKSLDDSILNIALATFCFSGTSFFGVLNEALAGDSSILFSKSVLDFSLRLYLHQ